MSGAAGSGKTLFGVEFLVKGAVEFNEPGVCFTFEETAQDLVENTVSLGFDLQKLVDGKKIVIDHVSIDPHEIHETGDYDLEGLFVRLGYAIDSVGAKRVMLDTLEALFAGLSDQALLRAELKRLFRWLKDRGVTAVISAEKSDGPTITRHGLEEFVSDCVVLLEHTLEESVLTRRLRVAKYRGSTHGTNEYPFLIDNQGISVLPLTTLSLHHEVSDERISSGIPDLDGMLLGGYFRGSTVLVSGTAGTGKTSVAVHFANAACGRGERVAYFGFEESPAQLARNMRSIGFDLQRWRNEGLLHCEMNRAVSFGIEKHLVHIHDVVEKFKPTVVVFDPATSFLGSGTRAQAQSMLLRLIDYMKMKGITALLTSLVRSDDSTGDSGTDVSSLVDTWLLLRDIEMSGERNRGLYILKSRGTWHSNQIREFFLTSKGVQLREAYLGADGVLTGSARAAQEAADELADFERRQEIHHRQQALEYKRKELEARISALQAEISMQDAELQRLASQEDTRTAMLEQQHDKMSASRKVSHGREDSSTPGDGKESHDQ